MEDKCKATADAKRALAHNPLNFINGKAILFYLYTFHT
jgi:hypothetical protein